MEVSSANGLSVCSICKGCILLFLPDRRQRDGRGVVKHKDLFVKIFQVKAVVSLSAAALVAVPNSQYGNPYMSIFFCDCSTINFSHAGQSCRPKGKLGVDTANSSSFKTHGTGLCASLQSGRTIFCSGSLALFRVPSCSR